MIVTIDGPAGSGKSTAARGLAVRLKFQFLDTGAMYRVVAWNAFQKGIDPSDTKHVAGIAETIDVAFRNDRVYSGETDVTEAIRTPDVTEAASIVAENEGVRHAMVELQRKIAQGNNVVCEGRDQGTVVFPDARCKIFLTADPSKRAVRRQQELQKRGVNLSEDEMFEQLHDRDERDTKRSVAPLKAAEDAILVDTTEMSVDEMLDELEQTVRNRME